MANISCLFKTNAARHHNYNFISIFVKNYMNQYEHYLQISLTKKIEVYMLTESLTHLLIKVHISMCLSTFYLFLLISCRNLVNVSNAFIFVGKSFLHTIFNTMWGKLNIMFSWFYYHHYLFCRIEIKMLNYRVLVTAKCAELSVFIYLAKTCKTIFWKYIFRHRHEESNRENESESNFSIHVCLITLLSCVVSSID